MQTYQDLTGPAAVVQARIAELEQRRLLLLALTPPRQHPDGWRVRVWVRAAGQPDPPPYRVPRAALMPARPPRQPGWPVPMTPQVAGRGVAGLGIAAVAAAVVWIIWQAVTSAVEWTGDHAGQLIAAAVLVGLGGLARLARKLRRPGCPGHINHCSGCKNH